MEGSESYFVLDERGEPQPERDLEAWTRWFESADRSVRRTVVSPEVAVLTTFCGYTEGGAASACPLLFETRVFGGLLDGEEGRQSTRDDALETHAALVEWCRVGASPDLGVSEDQLT